MCIVCNYFIGASLGDCIDCVQHHEQMYLCLRLLYAWFRFPSWTFQTNSDAQAMTCSCAWHRGHIPASGSSPVKMLVRWWCQWFDIAALFIVLVRNLSRYCIMHLAIVAGSKIYLWQYCSSHPILQFDSNWLMSKFTFICDWVLSAAKFSHSVY